MAYSYGTQGAPVVGSGAPGLPSRSSVGSIKFFATQPSPDWLLCDGAAYNVADYPALASTVSGSPAGTTLTSSSFTGVSGTSTTGMDCSNDGLTIAIGYSASSSVSVSQDGGLTWPIAGNCGTTSPNILYSGNGVFLALKSSFCTNTTNFSTWTASSGTLFSTYSNLANSAFAADLLGRVIAIGNDGTSSRYWYSTDYGISFTAGAINTNILLNAACYDLSGNWYAGSATGIVYKLSTFGSGFVSVSTIPGSTSISSIAVYKNTIVVLAGTSTYTAYISRDAGSTWNKLFPNAAFKGIKGVRVSSTGVWSIPVENMVLTSSDNFNTIRPFRYAADVASNTSSMHCTSDNSVFVTGTSTVTNFWKSDVIPTQKFCVPSIGYAGNQNSGYYIKAR